METILLLAHTETDGSLAKSVREALHAAATLHKALAGSTLVIGLIGESVQAAANSIAACPATKYFGVSGADFGQARYASDAAAAEAIAKAAQATLVVAPATSRLNRCLAGVAQRLGGRADTHVTGVAAADGKISVNRWYYRQRMEATLQRAQRPWFILVDPGSQAACQCGAEPPPWRRRRATAGCLPAHDRCRCARAAGRCANHPPRCTIAVCDRRRLDQETGRRPGAPGGGGEIDPRISSSQPCVAGQQQIAGGPKRRGTGRVVRSCLTSTRSARPAPRRAIPRAFPPVATAKSRTRSAGASSPSAAPSTWTPTAAGRAARPTCSMSPTPSQVMAKVNELLAAG